MSRRKTIHLSAFDMTCVGHQSPGLWRHPDDQSHRYKDLGYWTELARLLERGLFDSLFIADVLVSSTYEQPYNLARKFTTLDHLTKGRVGWNVVTSYLDSAARNLALGTPLVAEVSDELLPANPGRYRIDAGGVSRTAEPAGISLGVAALAAAYLGGTRFGALAAAGRVTEHLPGAVALADALFGTERAPFAGTGF